MKIASTTTRGYPRKRDQAINSYIESANAPDCEFSLANLPLGVIKPGHIVSRVGDRIVDLHACANVGLLSREFLASDLKPVMAAGSAFRAQQRSRLQQLLSHDSTHRIPEQAILRESECEMKLPAAIGDYTDFYSSIHHATKVGKLFRPDAPLLPNYKHVPIAYHGRASSVVLSGTDVRRPYGQLSEGNFGPSQRLDYEMELGFFVGSGNELGSPIPIGRAADSIFGYCLVNDWSARDIQRWEYQPLGPFLSKSFATSISPWIVMPEALQPYRGNSTNHRDNEPLPYLRLSDDPTQLAITLEVSLNGQRLGRASTRDLYWTPAQMLAHHSSNGCNLRPGDLMATGTISGEGSDECGCLLESRPDGPFLQDGDRVVIRGYAEAEGLPRIGFGECSGVVLPALENYF